MHYDERFAFLEQRAKRHGWRVAERLAYPRDGMHAALWLCHVNSARYVLIWRGKGGTFISSIGGEL